jgi:hypothetical protein
MREVGVEKSRQRIKRGKFGELNYLLLLARAFLELLNRLLVSLSTSLGVGVFSLPLRTEVWGHSPCSRPSRARFLCACSLQSSS